MKHIFEDLLPSFTSAKDEIVFIWSGHGVTVSDANNDEVDDNLDEALILGTYAVGEEKTTAILDDLLADWIKLLKDRRVLIVVDSCFAAGVNKGVKGIGVVGFGNRAPAVIDGELMHKSEMPIAECVLFASCSAHETSLTRFEEDHSVLIGEILSRLRATDGPITLKYLFDKTSAKVEEYVTRKFALASQTPKLIGEFEKPFILRYKN